MKKFFALFVIFAFIFVLSLFCYDVAMADSQPPKQAYFSAIPDIPLMPNMHEIEEQGFVFDKAEGKVIEVLGFLSAVNSQKIHDYYQLTLQSLGWKPLKNNEFQRNNERLLMTIEANPRGTLVRFQLMPMSRVIRH